MGRMTRFSRYCPILALATIHLLGDIPSLAAPSPPPEKPEYVEEWNANQELVINVVTRFEMDNDDSRAVDIVRGTDGTRVRVYTYPEWATPEVLSPVLFIPRVTVKGIAENVPQVWGPGFARDPLPITVRVRENKRTRLKYVVTRPNQGTGYVDALVESGELAEADLLRIEHLRMDGGDVVAGGGRLYISENLFERNLPLSADSVRALLGQYLGFKRDCIVVLRRPPSEASGHADLLVRTLPGGKVVVSIPGPGMSAADSDALNENLARVTAAVGAANVVAIPTHDASPLSTYANAVITKNRLLLPKFGGDNAPNLAAKQAYEAALAGRKYTVRSVQAFECAQVGGGPRCRVGTLAFAQENDAATQELHDGHRCPGTPDPCPPGGEDHLGLAFVGKSLEHPRPIPNSVPSPAMSTVSPCLVTCPAGDIPFEVWVRDAGGSAAGPTSVVLELAACGAVPGCPPDGSYGVDAAAGTVYATTDAAGYVAFPLQLGGTCPTGTVRVWADGVLLATRAMASPDVTGDLLVDEADHAALFALGGTVPGSDLDCDGVVTSPFSTEVETPHRIDSFRASVAPNPVRAGAQARLGIDLTKPATIEADVFDLAGRRVATRLIVPLGAGRHSLPWEALGLLPPGVFTMRVRADRLDQVRVQVVVLR